MRSQDLTKLPSEKKWMHFRLHIILICALLEYFCKETSSGTTFVLDVRKGLLRIVIYFCTVAIMQEFGRWGRDIRGVSRVAALQEVIRHTRSKSKASESSSVIRAVAVGMVGSQAELDKCVASGEVLYTKEHGTQMTSNWRD
eukprot:5150025-Amphidinium_carterae.1